MLVLGIPNKKQVVRNNFEHFYLPPFPLQNPQTPFMSQKIDISKSGHVGCLKNGLGARISTQKTVTQSEVVLLRYRPFIEWILAFQPNHSFWSLIGRFLSNQSSDWVLVFCVEILAPSPFFWHPTCPLLEKLIFWLIKGVWGFWRGKGGR